MNTMKNIVPTDDGYLIERIDEGLYTLIEHNSVGNTRIGSCKEKIVACGARLLKMPLMVISVKEDGEGKFVTTYLVRRKGFASVKYE